MLNNAMNNANHMTPRVVVIASIENVQNMTNSKKAGRRGEIAKTKAQNKNAGKNN